MHTGLAYVGAVGSKEGVNEIAVLGNAANLTARLSSKAAKGEVLISEEAASLGQIGGPDPGETTFEIEGHQQTSHCAGDAGERVGEVIKRKGNEQICRGSL